MKPAPTMKAAIEKLVEKNNTDLHKPGALLRLDMAGFDQLRIERLPNRCISVAHVFETQGFLIPEPVSVSLCMTKGTGYQSISPSL